MRLRLVTRHAPFRLACAPAPGFLSLNLATSGHSPVHSSIGTPSGRTLRLLPPTDCTLSVSDSLSLPSPGFFSPFPHGTTSLSVARGTRALEGGPPGFPPRSSCRAVLTRSRHDASPPFGYGTLTHYGAASHPLPLDGTRSRGPARGLHSIRTTPREHRAHTHSVHAV